MNILICSKYEITVGGDVKGLYTYIVDRSFMLQSHTEIHKYIIQLEKASFITRFCQY